MVYDLTMSKVSNLNLYASDKLEEKCLHVVSVDAKLSMTSPNVFEWHAPQFSIQGQTTAAHDIDDVGLKIFTMTETQASDHATSTAGIAANVSSISQLDVREAANHAAQGALLGAEAAARAVDIASVEQKITDEETRATAAEGVLTAAIAAETAARTTAVSDEATARASGDSSLQSQIDALGVTDAATLAQINAMLAAFEASDNSLLVLISALTDRVVALENTVATLTA